jgi:transcriptional regulator with XRE-family HTH domain
MLDDLGDKIRKARTEQSVSQKDLGVSLGLSDKAVSAYESNRTIPPLETLIRIAEELNKPLDYFIKGNSEDYAIESQLSRIEKELSNVQKELARIKRIPRS